MISVLLLLVSGLYNTAMKAIGFELSGMYNALLLIKIVLALAVFYLTAVLSGRSATAQKFRERETHWLNILCGLMIAIVLIASYMKMSSTNFKIKDRSATESASQLQVGDQL
jgi:NADH:ubiquinone oxidoreductase subunit 6 (subunit J)